MLKHLRQLAGESIVYGLSAVVSRFLSLFLVPIYTRLFTPEDYGVMSLVTTTMSIVSIFVVLALDSSVARWYWETEDVTERKRTVSSWAWCQLLVASAFALAITASADWLGQTIVGRADAGLYFRLMALTLPLSVFGTVTINWLRMQRRPWATTGFTLTTSLLAILLTFLLVVVQHRGLSGVYLALVIAGAIGTALAIWLLRDWANPRYFGWDRLREMLHYALPLIPAGLAIWVVNSSGRYFVQYYTNTSEVGLYQVGSSIAAVAVLATGAFQYAWRPFALSIHRQDDAPAVYAGTLLAFSWLMAVISTALALFAPEAIMLFATPEYQGASSVVGILAFSFVIGGLIQIAALGPSLAWTTRPIGLAMSSAAVLTILLNVLLVPRWGMNGSAFATMASQAAVAVYLFYRSQQLYPIPYRFGPTAGILAFALVVISLCPFLAFTNLWVGIAVKVVLLALFIPALFLFQIVTPAQVRRLLPA